jgi:hypothetical protein
MTAAEPDAGSLPPCGLYRTTAALGDIPAGRLVSFHNHGDRGPGVFLPTGWIHHRAQFGAVGAAIPSAGWSRTLSPLAPEGVYRVREAFYCCERQCRLFAQDSVVQLAYTPDADPVVLAFAPRDGALVLPLQGNLVERAVVARLAPLQVPGWA